MASKKSTISVVPEASQNNRHKITLIARATQKYPDADPNPKRQLGTIVDSLQDCKEHLESLHELTGMDKESPILNGVGYFISEIAREIEKNARYLEDIANTLTVQK